MMVRAMPRTNGEIIRMNNCMGDTGFVGGHSGVQLLPPGKMRS